MNHMEELSNSIKHDVCLVFSLSNLLGTFPYDIHTLKISKIFAPWSFIIHATELCFLYFAYVNLRTPSDAKIDFYSDLLLRMIICTITVVCVLSFCNMFVIRMKLREIFSELNRVHSYFTQLSCQDTVPNNVARKQLWTVSLFLLFNLTLLSVRVGSVIIRNMFLHGLAFPCSLILMHVLTFSTVLQCTNLLDLVKQYLNIINIELINISNNQDKQHFIHLYKSRICEKIQGLFYSFYRRKFKVFTQLHFTLSKLCHDIVNHTYSFPLFLIILMESFQLTSTLYFTLTTVLQSKSILHVLHVLIYFHVWVAYNVFMLVWIIRHCEATKYAGNSLLELVYHKIIYDEAPALNPELTHFLDCICNHKIRLRALDVFDIDYTVLSHVSKMTNE
ncbi:hypothetical protein M8J76_002306 [Diaphorina citri]|nr:hypothetical protein M8J76_002306 [Diaphorina citri]